jgi:hypothetical protein
MSDRHDDERTLSREDEALVRNVADLYAAPPAVVRCWRGRRDGLVAADLALDDRSAHWR